MAIQTVAAAPLARLNGQGRAIFALRERYVKCKSNRQRCTNLASLDALGAARCLNQGNEGCFGRRQPGRGQHTAQAPVEPQRLVLSQT